MLRSVRLPSCESGLSPPGYYKPADLRGRLVAMGRMGFAGLAAGLTLAGSAACGNQPPAVEARPPVVTASQVTETPQVRTVSGDCPLVTLEELNEIMPAQLQPGLVEGSWDEGFRCHFTDDAGTSILITYANTENEAPSEYGKFSLPNYHRDAGFEGRTTVDGPWADAHYSAGTIGGDEEFTQTSLSVLIDEDHHLLFTAGAQTALPKGGLTELAITAVERIEY